VELTDVELAQPVAARRMARHAALGVASWAKLPARLAVRMTARAAIPWPQRHTHRGETNLENLLEDLSMEEEILPQ
jgi:hypothetical protein